MALQQDLNVDQGALFEWDFKLRTDQATIFDLTDYQVRGQVRRDYGTAVLFTPDFTISIPLGSIAMTITPETTSALSFTGEELECVYDIEIYNADESDVKRIVSGTMTILREVTRP